MAHGLGSRDRLDLSTFWPLGPGLFVPETICTALYEVSPPGFCTYCSICLKRLSLFPQFWLSFILQILAKMAFSQTRNIFPLSPLISISTSCCFSKSTSHNLQLVFLSLGFISLLLLDCVFHTSRESIFCSP